VLTWELSERWTEAILRFGWSGKVCAQRVKQANRAQHVLRRKFKAGRSLGGPIVLSCAMACSKSCGGFSLLARLLWIQTNQIALQDGGITRIVSVCKLLKM